MVISSFPIVVDLYIYVILYENWAFFATKGDLLYLRDNLSHNFANKMRTTHYWEVIEPILKTRQSGITRNWGIPRLRYVYLICGMKIDIYFYGMRYHFSATLPK